MDGDRVGAVVHRLIYALPQRYRPRRLAWLFRVHDRAASRALIPYGFDDLYVVRARIDPMDGFDNEHRRWWIAAPCLHLVHQRSNPR